MTEVKVELFNNYKKTIKKISDVQNEEEYNDHDYIENIENIETVENTESQGTDVDMKYAQRVINKIQLNK